MELHASVDHYQFLYLNCYIVLNLRDQIEPGIV